MYNGIISLTHPESTWTENTKLFWNGIQVVDAELIIRRVPNMET